MKLNVKLNVKLKILLIAAIPLMVAMWFMFGTVLTKYSIVNEMGKQAPASSFLIKSGLLVHELNKERGLAFLATLKQSSINTSNLLTQYRETDSQISDFLTFTDSFETLEYSDQLPDRLKKTQEALKSLKLIRSNVGSNSISNDDVEEEYSKVIDFLISAANMPVQYGTNSEIIRSRRAMINFIEAKDRIGLEQIVLTRAFEKDSFADGVYGTFNTLDSEEKTYLDIFFSLATDEQLIEFSKRQSDPVMAEFQNMHDIATNKGIAPESTIYIVTLTQEFGYGGAIHAFKNYVLRKDEKYAENFKVSYEKIKASSDKLSELFSGNKRNLRYLKKVTATIDKYNNALEKVKGYIAEGLSSAAIDKRVNISDKAAIISIGTLVKSTISGNFSIDPIHMYNTVSGKLNLLNEVEIILADDLSKLMINLEDEAWNSLLLMAFVISVLIAVVLFTVFFVAGNIVKPLNSTVDFALSIADGDLTGKLDVNRSDEIGVLANAINKMANNLKHMVQNINDTTTQLASSAKEVTVVTAKTTKDVTQQQTELMSISTAMNEMNNTVQSIADNAIHAKDATDNASNESSTGQEIVASTLNSINALSGEVDNASLVIKELAIDSENIGNVLGVIRNIAEQTNLLALNAAIEAARAGEQGRGFAVVADEVRVLASRTQEATVEIQDMVERLQAGSDKAVLAMAKGSEKTVVGVEYANKASEILVKITDSVSIVSDITSEIATATEEQTATVGEIDRSITSINSLAEETASGAEVTSKSINDLAALANNLQEIVGKFRV